jgi:CRP-like cAMP-binding protein
MNPSEKYYRSGMTIFQENTLSKCLYIVQSGFVSICKSKGGNSIELARVGAGEIIGEMSLFDRKARSASAIAVTEVKLIEIPYESLDKIFEPLPDYYKKIIMSMVDRLRQANETIRLLQKELSNAKGIDIGPDLPEEDNLGTAIPPKSK